MPDVRAEFFQTEIPRCDVSSWQAIVLAIVAVVVPLAVYGAITNRKLAALKQQLDRASEQLTAAMRRRAELFPDVSKSIRAAAEYVPSEGVGVSTSRLAEFIKLNAELDRDISGGRRLFASLASEFNMILGSFPSSIVARIKGHEFMEPPAFVDDLKQDQSSSFI